MMTGIKALWKGPMPLVSVYHPQRSASSPTALNRALTPRSREPAPGAKIHCQTTPVTTNERDMGKR
jgi:hypothetical protein